ncbi:threonine synthase [Bartonella doshiae]|uniref:Threonine synthase n=2 Tax=Bartonella doshiae TaxID=33044 RepID=A0A380ZD27_BARDO|nr:threonine synthase [Bartonella doshiae]EJF81993.1 threonine synthase [Bartonella doshiae NCTC 12862 = ATCC 700133]MBB6158988.1 threonine synthase [Bartonella doshiae]SUV44581.1 Threonine synthase [Bartonella doshiae]
MKYISTRGEAPALNFTETIMTGLACDGGLYLPEKFPQLSPNALRALRGQSYTTIAKTILWPFVNNEIEYTTFENIIANSYATFRHPATCPLLQTDTDEFILELFHGPTLAFKDVAMQFLARLMDYVLTKKNKRATIIAATSGDTGGAAIQAFAGKENSDIFILFPKGRVSPIQQRQMTTDHSPNVHAIAIEGNFDDCQALVKALFNDHDFRQKVALSGVNSINWARIMAQIVYYFSSALSLGAPDRAVSFTVPTGNFGDIFAGYVATRMGLPIAQLVIATNDNDILTRTLISGTYEIQPIIHTISPSMDIQVSSNFERLLFESGDRDPVWIRNAMENLKKTGRFNLDEKQLKNIRSLFSAGKSNVAETTQIIDNVYKESGYFVDPHTAVALKIARENKQPHIPMIVLATAHPAKFPDAIKNACGIHAPYPSCLNNLMEHEEHFISLANDEKIVKNYISLKSHASY